MNLYLMRHTQPVTGHPANAERPLTPEGEQCAKDMAAWLAGHIGRVDIVIHSPFVRAVQTAIPTSEALGAHMADTRMLQPDGKPAEMWAEITRLAQASKDVLVVGHDPSLNALICWMQGNELDDTDGTNCVRLEWGSVALLAVKGTGTGVLQWLVTPAIVLADKDVVEAARELVDSVEAARPSIQTIMAADKEIIEAARELAASL